MEFVKESIIVSAVRTFCRSFAGILGLLVGGILVFAGLMMFSSPDIYPPKSTLTLSTDANGNRELLAPSAPVILRIDLTGVIGQGDLTAEKFQNALSDSRDGMLAGNRVKAVFIFMNTPGGAVDDANGIYQALLDYKKKYNVPIYTYVEGMCCSGGMYIACATDKIFASSTSIIGSVGVILGPTFNFSGLMGMYGVQAMTITEGKDKDMLNPFRPWVPGEDASLRQVTATLYQQFVSIVTTARPELSKQKLIDDYGAQIFVSKKAQELGYIDVADTDYSMAMTELAKAAQIPEAQSYQVMAIQPAHPFLSDLTSGTANLLSGKIVHEVQIDPSLPPELQGKFLYLYRPNQ